MMAASIGMYIVCGQLFYLSLWSANLLIGTMALKSVN